MGDVLDRWTDPQRMEAKHELRAELAGFCPRGLARLAHDLRAGIVTRGGWAGCVLSYRRGSPGSVRQDRLGRRRNAATALWDSGRLTDEEVVEVVAREIRRRRAAVDVAA
jgi:hypothetical protein